MRTASPNPDLLVGLHVFDQSNGLDHETTTDERSQTRANAYLERNSEERRTAALAAAGMNAISR